MHRPRAGFRPGSASSQRTKTARFRRAVSRSTITSSSTGHSSVCVRPLSPYLCADSLAARSNARWSPPISPPSSTSSRTRTRSRGARLCSNSSAAPSAGASSSSRALCTVPSARAQLRVRARTGPQPFGHLLGQSGSICPEPSSSYARRARFCAHLLPCAGALASMCFISIWDGYGQPC
jgi:hypothetical protein